VRDDPTPGERPTGVPARARPRAELPGDLVAAIRTAGAALPTRGRERLVVLAAEAVEAYNRGRYEEAARRISPVAEAAPRVAGVREIAGLANYRAGKWRAGAAHLRAHHDLTGDVEHLPAAMDCERALRHPRTVARLYDVVRASSPDVNALSEARIVMAASLADAAKFTEAIELMIDAGAAKRVRNPAVRHVRQWYVLADLYERSGDVPHARELFSRVASAEPGAFDVDDRLKELGARQHRSRSKAR
jgi:tetratricopeptide (TPR) repeat protein